MSKQRRSFSPEFKAEVADLIIQHGRAVSDVCRELDLMAHTDPDMARAYQRGHARKVLVVDMLLPANTLTDSNPAGPEDVEINETRARYRVTQLESESSPFRLTKHQEFAQPIDLGSSALMGDAGTPVFIKLILRRSFNGDNTDVPRRIDTRPI